ncbi:MAG: MotA/TolQ/ExbB proton channel family protein [Betaproteobacteria bacterium]
MLTQGDAVSLSVAWVLLAMSVASWVLMIWKSWLLLRLRRDLRRSMAAFWQAPSIPEAASRARAFDTQGLLHPLLEACQSPSAAQAMGVGHADARARLTRLLRQGLQSASDRLQYGQILLATVGSTAPFVGLLGTVWGIYLALGGMAQAGQLSIDRVAGPIGEALIMTAAGLAVALPAVLAFNVMGRFVSRLEAELEGFAHDLLGLLAGVERAS